MSRPRAAVDSGTNSTRLLVVDGTGRPVVRRTEITRLGQGVDATGRLDDDALARTLDVIATYRDLWLDAGVAPGDVRIAATSAVRDADDRDRYFSQVREVTGVTAEVLSGEQEARLSFLGALGRVDVPTPALLVDIGGGSTELVEGGPDGVAASHSMQVGAVRVTERHLHDDPPTRAQVDAARRMVDEALDGAQAAMQGQGAGPQAARSLVGVAGTVASLGALHAGLPAPDDPGVHGQQVPADEVAAWAHRLLAMSVAERRGLSPIPPARADVVAAGALILDHVVRRTGATEVVVSLADNLDGLVATMA